MSDNNHIEQDLMFRSILENGQEEVPARVWDGVASGLDRIAHRKKVVLWWKRAAASTAAAAAIVTGILLGIPGLHRSEPVPNDQIAVVTPDVKMPAEEKPAEVMSDDEIQVETIAEAADRIRYLAYAPAGNTESPAVAETPETETPETETVETETVGTTVPEKDDTDRKNPVRKSDISDDVWKEDTRKERKKVKVSLVLSSTTGANGENKTTSNGMLRRPMSPNALIQTGITERGNDRFALPLSFGVGAKIDFAKKWSVGVGVNYTLLSRKFEGDYLKVENGNILEYTESEIRNNQHYIGIPVNVYYNIIGSEKINFYTYAGGTVEKCVANDFNVLKTKSVHKEKVKGVQCSANIGVGVEFMAGKHLGLYIDPSARYYFNNRQPKSVRTSQPLMFGVEIGLRTRF